MVDIDSSSREPQVEISSTKLLLVEGVDDQAVFNALWGKMGIEDVQILRYDGKSKFRNFVADLIALDGFGDVETIGLTTDVDHDPNAARDRVRGALANASLPVPDQPLTFAEAPDSARIAYLLIPHDSDSGAMEDVCLASIEDVGALTCVDEFMACVEESGRQISRRSKARIHAYLSTRRDPDKRIGEAVAAGYLPFDSDAFDPLRRLIEML